MTRIDILIESLRELGSRDCSHNFDGADHHTVMVAAAKIEQMRTVLLDISEARGMFGVDYESDLKWAINHAGTAIANLAQDGDTPQE